MPTLAQLASFYPDNYHAQTGEGLLNRMRQGMRFKHLRPFMQRDGAILDYGCGNGAFLRYAAEKLPGRRFFGYEIAKQKKIVEHAGGAVTLIYGSFDDLLQNLPVCGLITLNHVIEHLPNIDATVGALVERLAPGGVFEGQTPAAGSLEHRVFRRYWSGYHAPRHTVVFSPFGLRTFLERVGLKQVKAFGAFNPAAVAVSLASVVHRGSGTGIPRHGLTWLAYLGFATILAPVDLLSGAPGIQNFLGIKPTG